MSDTLKIDAAEAALNWARADEECRDNWMKAAQLPPLPSELMLIAKDRLIGRALGNWLMSACETVAPLRQDLARVTAELATCKEDAEAFQTLREAAGYVEDGSATEVRFGQDDATRCWHIKVGNRDYYGDYRELLTAIAAIKEEGMSDIDKIRREQIQAGEDAVLRNLERKGLADLVSDDHFSNRKAIKAVPIPDAAPQEEPKEELASRLIDVWCAEHERKISWAKAVQIIAIVTGQPDEERDRLLRMGDNDGACEMCGRKDAAPAVPREPTEEMSVIGAKAITKLMADIEVMPDTVAVMVWKAMYDAATEPKEGS